MKLLARTILLFSLITLTGLVSAHSDHGVINEKTAIEIAQKAVQQMTFKDFGYQAGKLDASWKSVKAADFEVVEVGDGFYVLRIAQSETKQFLSMKIGFSGQVLEVTENSDE